MAQTASAAARDLLADSGGDVCQACGACCATDASWPRFSLETEEEIARIPIALVAESQSGMRCDGDRCLALAGEIGKTTRCTIYEMRPQVCRSCMPGDDACLMARARHRLYDMPLNSSPILADKKDVPRDTR
jgi:Fe-S-cluster containining protein